MVRVAAPALPVPGIAAPKLPVPGIAAPALPACNTAAAVVAADRAGISAILPAGDTAELLPVPGVLRSLRVAASRICCNI